MRLKPYLTTLFSTGLLIGLFPWIFSYRGVVFGLPVSIRALGDALGFLMALFGTLALFRPTMRERIKDFSLALESLPNRKQNLLIVAATLVFLIGVISHKLRAHAMLATHAYDLGFFSNICWNTANGNWFFSSDLERNFMGVHVNWVLWPLSLVYRFWAGAPVLLVAQAVIMSAALPILWKAAQRITGYFVGGAVAALLLASSPYFEHPLSNDFHPDVWLMPCLFAALWAWHAGRRALVLLFCALSLLAKEDVSVVLCGFAVMLFIQKNWRMTGAALMGISLGAFYFHTQVMIPRYLEGSSPSLLFSRYPLLGANYQDFLHNMAFEPHRLLKAFAYEPSKYWRLFCYLLPMAGLSLLTPLLLLPPIISALPHILSQAGTQLSLADIYSLPAQPFLFIGAAMGAKKLIESKGTPWFGRFGGVLLVVAGFGVYNSPRYFKVEPAARIAAFKEARALIPPLVTLAAQHNLQPHFDTRRYIQLFPIRNSMVGLQRRYLENPDYIFADRIGNGEPGTGVQLRAAIAALEANPAYEKLFEKENFLVFVRRQPEEMRWITLSS